MFDLLSIKTKFLDHPTRIVSFAISIHEKKVGSPNIHGFKNLVGFQVPGFLDPVFEVKQPFCM